VEGDDSVMNGDVGVAGVDEGVVEVLVRAT
jgi:hypothetical protein